MKNKQNKSKIGLLILLVVGTTFFMFKDTFFPNASIKEQIITEKRYLPIRDLTIDSNDVTSSDDTSLTESHVESVENTESSKEQKRMLNTRSEQFARTIDLAYENETAILIGKQLALNFYNVKEGTAETKDLFTNQAETAVAEALAKQYQELVANKMKREEKLTTYTILTDSPLTIQYHILGTKNDAKDQVTYEVVFNDTHDKVSSFVQVVK